MLPLQYLTWQHESLLIFMYQLSSICYFFHWQHNSQTFKLKNIVSWLTVIVGLAHSPECVGDGVPRVHIEIIAHEVVGAVSAVSSLSDVSSPEPSLGGVTRGGLNLSSVLVVEVCSQFLLVGRNDNLKSFLFSSQIYKMERKSSTQRMRFFTFMYQLKMSQFRMSARFWRW